MGSMPQVEQSSRSITNNGTPADTVIKLTPIKNRNSYNYKINVNKISLNPTANSKQYVQNEMKAVKVLGVVFACFLVSWLPYCLINIGTVLCSIYKIEIFDFQHFLSYLTYIGYISSTFNPIIYTAFNKKFRQNFTEILKCTCTCK